LGESGSIMKRRRHAKTEESLLRLNYLQ